MFRCSHCGRLKKGERAQNANPRDPWFSCICGGRFVSETMNQYMHEVKTDVDMKAAQATSCAKLQWERYVVGALVVFGSGLMVAAYFLFST